ncbi:toprim domain-containing protein [Clostridium perfringens]|uniref:toprim domain-containing protein n=1 Tax=Clostridium perfringens TaxID=1502 RepID=UPI001ABB5BE5|nr:toprim domain-containing protein [Clostridium perfringens]MBO3339857.1 toprim domain-containing protein [Clostridium perfringens]MDK0581880.1 toprim domain-containing protein [Clostridium perfringens]MDK0842844.1 toprim domain-containing protein [Clostridium perfringens]MDM0696512.1 toprim domain-containing protein [Clostridium perfringens]MDM1008174.1 toprim domain-containing protein [Clostridium perfringens]
MVGIRQKHTQDYYIAKEGKYRPISGYEFPSGATLYGINIAKEDIKKTKEVVLFEGEKSVMKYNSLYDNNNSTAVFGSNISYQQIGLLQSLEVKTVVLAFDKDYEGIESSEAIEYRQKLDKLVDKLRVHFDVKLIWDNDGLLGISQVL